MIPRSHFLIGILEYGSVVVTVAAWLKVMDTCILSLFL